jgi:CrcB protein
VIVALAVGLAGGAGSIARYLIDGAVQDRTDGILPFGTLTVNVLGSFVLGLLTGVVLFHTAGGEIRTIAGDGFCGGLTTWSAASWETVQLAEAGQARAAALTALGGLAAALAAAGLGMALSAL